MRTALSVRKRVARWFREHAGVMPVRNFYRSDYPYAGYPDGACCALGAFEMAMRFPGLKPADVINEPFDRYRLAVDVHVPSAALTAFEAGYMFPEKPCPDHHRRHRAWFVRGQELAHDLGKRTKADFVV